MEINITQDALVERLKASTSAQEALGVLWAIKSLYGSPDANFTLILADKFLVEHDDFPETEQIVQRFLNIRNKTSPNFYRIAEVNGKRVLLNNVNVNAPTSFYAKDEKAALEYAERIFGYKFTKIGF
jgi:hypothetical protein